MDRLLLTSTAALVAGLFSISVEAQIALPTQDQGATYTIAGDVDGARNVSFPYGQTVTARDLLNQIGLNQPKGNAVILRGRPLRTVLGENFAPGYNGPGTPLVVGDVVIFRRLENWQSPIRNVVVVSQNGAEVLDFSAGSPFRLGQLPGVSSSINGVTVTRTSFGSSQSVVLSPSEYVQHGDVIQVDAAAPAGLQIVENSAVDVAADQPVLTLPTEPAGQGDSALSSIAGLTIPGMQSTTQPELPDEFSPFESVESSGVEQDDDGVFRTASFQSGAEAAADDLMADEIFAAAPVATTSSSNALWNVLFVLGLVFALGLIVIGWVKTQQERQHELAASGPAQVGISDSQPINASFAQPQNVVPDRLNEEEILQTLSSAEDTTVPTEEIELTAADIEPVADLNDELWVETAETTPSALSTEAEEATSVDDDCPILSAGFDSLAAAGIAGAGLAATAAGTENSDALGEFTAQESAAEEVATDTGLVGSDEWFGADWRTSVTEPVTADIGEEPSVQESPIEEPQPVAESLPEQPVAMQPEMTDAMPDDDDDEMDIDDTVVEHREAPVVEQRRRNEEEVAITPPVVEATDDRSDLEDLIHNRLPMELKQVDLPLQVSLFGRPSGPKRLRIDNAHTQIAAPHMMSGARRNQRPEKIAVAANRSTPLNTQDRNSDGQAEQGRGTPGLDKALNFIDERTDS